MKDPSGRLIARITLTVDVHLETDPGIDTPDARELPYEYLVVRDANAVSTETFGDARPLAIVEEGGFDDPDPDDLVMSELISEMWHGH